MTFPKKKGDFRHNRTGIFIPKEMQIFQLDYHTYSQIADPSTRGIHDIPSRKIILQETKWCKKTIIHECLHSVSIFSSNSAVTEGFQVRSLKEALTEFLTGYVLYKKHKQSCYFNWKTKRFSQWCDVSYNDGVKTLCALSEWLSISEFVRLYMWSPSSNWHSSWSRFSEKIKQVCRNFEDGYETWKKYNFMTELKYELINKLGKKFIKKRNLFSYDFTLT